MLHQPTKQTNKNTAGVVSGCQSSRKPPPPPPPPPSPECPNLLHLAEQRRVRVRDVVKHLLELIDALALKLLQILQQHTQRRPDNAKENGVRRMLTRSKEKRLPMPQTETALQLPKSPSIGIHTQAHTQAHTQRHVLSTLQPVIMEVSQSSRASWRATSDFLYASSARASSSARRRGFKGRGELLQATPQSIMAQTVSCHTLTHARTHTHTPAFLLVSMAFLTDFSPLAMSFGPNLPDVFWLISSSEHCAPSTSRLFEKAVFWLCWAAS